MKIMNRVACCLITALGVFIAVPALAADKLISLTSVSPAALPPESSVLANPCADLTLLTKVTATVKNESPKGGNSVINTAILNLLTDPTTAANVTLCGASAQGASTVTISGLSIFISNMNGVRPGNSFTITVYVYVAPGTPCTNGTWDIDAFAGNSFNGDPFLPITTGSDLKPALIGCDVLLACGSSYTEVSGSNTTTIKRETDKNNQCPDTPFNLLFSEQDRTVEVQWNEAANNQVVLRTNTVWPKELVDDLTTASVVETWPRRTRVAWFKDGNGDPIFVAAPACISSDVPTSATMSQTMPTMGTDASVPSVYQGQRARMCVISEAFDLQPFGACPQDPTKACAIVETDLYITGDAWLSRQ